MTLSNPETRRATRSVVHAIVVFTLLGLAWQLADKIDPRWVLAIIALAEFGHLLENTTRAFKLKVGRGGAEVEAGGE